jgi:hypothetical protein
VTALPVLAGDSEPQLLAPGPYTARSFTPQPTFTVGEGWSAAVVDTRFVALTRGSGIGSDCLCLFAPDGAHSSGSETPGDLAPDLAEWLAEHPGLDTSNPSSLQVGNRAARQLEITVSAAADLQGGVLPLFTAGDHTFAIAPGEEGHVVVIDHPSGPLIFALRAPADKFREYFKRSEPVAGSLGFGG